jgi:hypothetical protein
MWLRFFDRLESLLLAIPSVIWVALLPLLAVIHCGYELSMPYAGVANFTETYPTPLSGSDSGSYGVRTIAWLLQINEPDSFTRLCVFITCATLWIAGVLIWRVLPKRSAIVVSLLVALGPIGETLFGAIGRSDALVLLGALVLGVVGRNIWIGLLAGLIMVAGNPEQAVAASLAFVLVALALRTPGIVRAAVSSLVISVASYFSMLAWFQHLGNQSRVDSLGPNIRQSLSFFLQAAPISFYAAFGLAFVFIVIACTVLWWRRAVLLILGIVAIPMFFTAITLDQTRITVALSCAGIAAVLVWAVPRCLEALDEMGFGQGMSVLTVIAVVLPSIAVSYPGEIILPYRTGVEQFFNPAAGG